MKNSFPIHRPSFITHHSRIAGFTLIELITVIIIIGILVTLILVNLTSARERTRDAARKADLSTLRATLESYYGRHGAYPDDTFGGGAETSEDDSTNNFWCTSSCTGLEGQGTPALYQVQTEGFIQRVPIDPLNTNEFYYGFEPSCSIGSSGLKGQSGEPFEGGKKPQAVLVFAKLLEGNVPAGRYEVYVGGVTVPDAAGNFTCP